MMIMIKSGLKIINKDLMAVLDACSRLLEDHTQTPMAGRTQMQQALPITYGVKVSQWASSLVYIIPTIVNIQKTGLYMQWGGPVGMSSEENEYKV